MKAPSKTEQRRPLNPRELAILTSVAERNGILADFQIQRLHFPDSEYTVSQFTPEQLKRYGRTHRTTQFWMNRLKVWGYIEVTDFVHRVQLPGYNVCWLTHRGLSAVAEAKRISVQSLKWNKPYSRWSEVQHDIEVNDFQISFEQSVSRHPELALIEWIGFKAFASQPDRVFYPVLMGNKTITKRRDVELDGFALVEQDGRGIVRFAIEIDRSTHALTDIDREKVRAFAAYIKSPAYKRRFGYNGGRYLWETISMRRLKNLQNLIARYGNEHPDHATLVDKFYFTIKAERERADLFVDPIWYRGTEEQPTALLSSLATVRTVRVASAVPPLKAKSPPSNANLVLVQFPPLEEGAMRGRIAPLLR